MCLRAAHFLCFPPGAETQTHAASSANKDKIIEYIFGTIHFGEWVTWVRWSRDRLRFLGCFVRSAEGRRPSSDSSVYVRRKFTFSRGRWRPTDDTRRRANIAINYATQSASRHHSERLLWRRRRPGRRPRWDSAKNLPLFSTPRGWFVLPAFACHLILPRVSPRRASCCRRSVFTSAFYCLCILAALFERSLIKFWEWGKLQAQRNVTRAWNTWYTPNTMGKHFSCYSYKFTQTYTLWLYTVVWNLNLHEQNI